MVGSLPIDLQHTNLASLSNRRIALQLLHPATPTTDACVALQHVEHILSEE